MTGMRPEDIHDIRAVADPRLSPDGERVAFTVSWPDKDANETRGHIWLARVDGSEPPRQLTFGPRRDAEPRWSPDGTRLSFTSNRAGKTMQLYVMPVGMGGEARQLTDLKEDVGGTAWSPDGTRIAFASRVPAAYYDIEDEKKRPPRRIARLGYKLDNEGWTADRPQHVFVVPADASAAPVQITDGDHEDAQPAWAPDSSRIGFISSRHETWDTFPASDVYVVGTEGGEPARLTGTDAFCGGPSWSPDGAAIAFRREPGIFDSPRHAQIAVVPADGSRAPSLLTPSLDRNCAPFPEIREPVWDGSSILFGVEDGGNTHLYRVEGTGGEPKLVIGGEQTLTGYDIGGGTVVHTATSPTSTGELFAGNRPLTGIGRPFVEAHEIRPFERFTAASADGTEVDAWIVRPAGFEPGQRYPLLLNIHGGPFAQYGNRFFDEFQVYAGAGYAVAFSNPRGSSGYSEAWGRAIRGPVEGGPGWGTVDYEDVMAVAEEAVRRFDFVDPERLGVIGGSYGGYMTSWIVGHTDRFRAAVSERAVNDILAEGAGSDIAIWWKAITGAHYWERPEAMRRMSPSTYAEDIRTPLLILHSEDDLRCPISNAEDLFTRLRVLGRTVEFVRFPAEGHELSRSGSPFHRVQRFQVILEWFDRQLGNGD